LEVQNRPTTTPTHLRKGRRRGVFWGLPQRRNAGRESLDWGPLLRNTVQDSPTQAKQSGDFQTRAAEGNTSANPCREEPTAASLSLCGGRNIYNCSGFLVKWVNQVMKLQIKNDTHLYMKRWVQDKHL
jgi:hypothetical protein